MDPNLPIQAGMLVAAAGATAIAWWQAIVAGRRQRDAEGASRAATSARDAAVQAQQETAVALREANEIAREALEAQRLTRRPPWGDVRSMEKNTYRVLNQSGLPIVLTSVTPVGQAIKVFSAGEFPRTIAHGDSISFLAYTGGIIYDSGNAVEIEWHFVDEDEVHVDIRRF